ncbi:MAG: hypothetical protein Ct9H300mP1_29700 [Planctomycetaceae bacterium]|nr:MAG: hypothetical protein Ct9H300mP1_29700 [Planctomycetaceae bacterium]
MYRHLGIDPNKHYLDHSGRPIATLPFGKPMKNSATKHRARAPRRTRRPFLATATWWLRHVQPDFCPVTAVANHSTTTSRSSTSPISTASCPW